MDQTLKNPRSLTRRDLLDLEQKFCEDLGRILPLENHAIYFPPDSGRIVPEWLPEERRLLLPLRKQQLPEAIGGELLGVFTAQIADRPVFGLVRNAAEDPCNEEGKDRDEGAVSILARMPALLPSLPGIVTLCLEKLELYKNSRLDALTGLATAGVLQESLEQHFENIRASFSRMLGVADKNSPFCGTVGLIVCNCSGLRDVGRKIGYAFADRFLLALVESILGSSKVSQKFLSERFLPDKALVARIDGSTLAIMLPDTGPEECGALSAAVVRRLNAVALPHPLTGRPVVICNSAGYALFPQNLDGISSLLNQDQPRALIHRAGLAAQIARKRGSGGRGLLERVPSVGFGQLLSEGGRVVQVLPLSRVVTNLGNEIGARVGQRFSVWAASDADIHSVYKGEIVLLEIHEQDSLAEILCQGDTSEKIGSGDMLLKVPEGNAIPLHAEEVSPNNFVLTYRDFLARSGAIFAQSEPFGLVLLQIGHKGHGDGESGQEKLDVEAEIDAAPDPLDPLAGFPPRPDLCVLAESVRQAFAGRSTVICGQLGLNSLVFCHVGETPAALANFYREICGDEKRGAGIACWPYLNFKPSEMLDCVRKALEYAFLLPAPHVGLFDSLAMNISADKKHVQGDVFGAMEEYKQALLADENNGLAWNSLGVCLASLGHNDKASAAFERAIACNPEDTSALYNMGEVCQRMNMPERAETYFQRCLDVTPNHFYSLIRLGQLAQAGMQHGSVAGDLVGDPSRENVVAGIAQEVNEKALSRARKFFEAAAKLDDNSSLPFRHLAQLARQEGQPGLAREHVQQALQRNPHDAAALGLLAELYLDGGEDTELALSLARQCVALRSDYRKGWLILARGLELLGRRKEAQAALLRGGAL